MQRLGDIETMVRHHLRDGEASLSVDSQDFPGLSIANQVHRRMVAMTHPQDTTRAIFGDYVQTDNTKTSVARQEVYIFTFERDYMNLLLVEVQDHHDDNRYKRVLPVTSEFRWNQLGWEPPDIPRGYRTQSSNFTGQMAFRPTHQQGNKLFRFTGIIQPPVFHDEDSTTLFGNEGLDDAFALMIAGKVAAERAQLGWSQQLIAEASSTLRDLTGVEFMPGELHERING